MAINGDDELNPIDAGMKIYRSGYLFALDLVPAVPGINTQVGPVAGDNGKISIVINNSDTGNVFVYQVTKANLEII